ncbi:MAG: hypothetical protein M9955_04395 [Rhizobiaceae bacterium]|jgi:hypothetical protein|nr:hypothetical protein [Rhizobiaceae bacterium]
MARFETFDRDLRLAIADVEPDRINAALAKFAREELERVIQRGEGSPAYRRYVNRIEGAPETSVRAPGPILYEFVWWKPVILFALAELGKRSPRKSGRFASSFIVISGGKIILDFDDIAAEAEIVITNFQPYVRKAEAGLLNVPRRRIFDGTKRMINSRYSEVVTAETRFLNIAQGVHPAIPYILKGGAPLRAASRSARSSAFRAGRRFLAPRKDTAAGQALTYPSIVLNLNR